jgi:hypothetical protein
MSIRLVAVPAVKVTRKQSPSSFNRYMRTFADALAMDNLATQ